MRDETHILAIRVYWEDTDATGAVYHANYLKYAERARSDFLRLAGISQSTLLENGNLRFAVRRCEVNYKAPAQLDDQLEVLSRLTSVGGASVEFTQLVNCRKLALVEIFIRIACLDRLGKVRRLPTKIYGAFQNLYSRH